MKQSGVAGCWKKTIFNFPLPIRRSSRPYSVDQRDILLSFPTLPDKTKYKEEKIFETC